MTKICLTDHRDASRRLCVDMSAWGGNYRKEHVFVEIVRTHFGGGLQHITDERNLDSIKEHGLLSKRVRDATGIVSQYPGGSELTDHLNSKYRLDDQVFLSLTGQTIMPKHEDARYRRPCRLRINPEILLTRGVQVAKGAANHRDTDIYPAWRALLELDFELYFWGVDGDIHSQGRLRRFFDTEVLVPDRVPPEFLWLDESDG